MCALKKKKRKNPGVVFPFCLSSAIEPCKVMHGFGNVCFAWFAGMILIRLNVYEAASLAMANNYFWSNSNKGYAESYSPFINSAFWCIIWLSFFAFHSPLYLYVLFKRTIVLLTDRPFFSGLKVRLGKASRMLTNWVGVVSTK